MTEASRYEIAPDGTWIRCLVCGMKSYSFEDVRAKFCGNCRDHLDGETPDPATMSREELIQQYNRVQAALRFVADRSAHLEAALQRAMAINSKLWHWLLALSALAVLLILATVMLR